MKLKWFVIGFSVFLTFATGCKNEILRNGNIHLENTPASGVITLSNFSGTPDSLGVLKTFQVNVPAFKNMIYFGSDGNGRSGIIPSNRGFMWILDENFNLVNPPKSKKMAGAYGENATKEGTYSVFQLNDGSYLALLPLVGESTMSFLYYDNNKTPLLKLATFGTAPVQGNIPLFAYAKGKNIYEASYNVWAEAIKGNVPGVTAKFRSEKEYPEYWKYLGWCSWEEYRYRISSDLLANSMEKIHSSGVPVRWLLIDEGTEWYIDPEKGKNRFSLGLHSFKTDPERFPDGLAPLLKYKSEDGIKWMGIWHHQAGLYRGISKDNIMGEEMNQYFELLPNGRYMVKGDSASQYKFFEKLFEEPVKLGFDFIKVDFQGPQFSSYIGSANAVFAHSQTNKSLEAFGANHNLGIINCFAHDMVCAQNSSHSQITRASQDYRKGSPTAARVQTFQCYNNKIWMGQVVWGDHDMFHSSDSAASELMAISKAMSGAPIYVSDAPEHFVPEVIEPLCYSDGELIRVETPGVPLPESFFNAPINKKNLYRVIAQLANDAASIVCYNLFDSAAETTISGKVSADDYKYASAMSQPYSGEKSLPEEGLFLYDWQKKSGEVLTSDYEVVLSGLTDRLIHLCPIKNGWAMVGLTNKYLSPATISNLVCNASSVSFEVKEGGTLAFYLKDGVPEADGLKFQQIENGLWETVITKDFSGKIMINKS